MNKVKNLLNDFDKTWIIVADKKLSEREKTDAVKNLTTINNGGKFSFITNKNVIFDINEMIPRSETDYNSQRKKISSLPETEIRGKGVVRLDLLGITLLSVKALGDSRVRWLQATARMPPSNDRRQPV
jgi:hypothetical protein